MMLAAPEFTTLTLSIANASAIASGLSESSRPAHDCAADRAAASEAFTMARRLYRSWPTSTVSTITPQSAIRVRATMTAVAPRSSP